MFKIGPYRIDGQAVLAPMAGISDRPFREICRRFGAALVVSEMVTSDTRLWNSRKSSSRLNYTGEIGPISVQIAGADPKMLADAAQMCVESGAHIIDINMGCPAKKVCNKAAGSALLRDEPLVESILTSVVNAVKVPVTLKIRTGWSPEERNGVRIARIAEDLGIAALAVHGRTRACGFRGEAEYETIASIKQSISIPVIANGDINSPEKAYQVLRQTGADAVMIGRSAQGQPWIFEQINSFLKQGTATAEPSIEIKKQIMLDHLEQLSDLYGDYMGVRIARKHVAWYMQNHPEAKAFRKEFNQLETAADQVAALELLFNKITHPSHAA